MSKAIIIRTPEFEIFYNDNFRTEVVYQIRGIEGRFKAPLHEVMHPFILEFLTGRKARRIFHKGCAARKWRNPVAEYQKFLKEKQEAQQRESARIAEIKADKKEKARRQAILVQLFENPIPSNWEAIDFLHEKAVVFSSLVLTWPQQETNRKRITQRLEKAKAWNKKYQEFLAACKKYNWPLQPVGHIGNSRPGTLEIFGGNSLTFWAHESWGHKFPEFVEASERRLQELNELYAS